MVAACPSVALGPRSCSWSADGVELIILDVTLAVITEDATAGLTSVVAWGVTLVAATVDAYAVVVAATDEGRDVTSDIIRAFVGMVAVFWLPLTSSLASFKATYTGFSDFLNVSNNSSPVRFSPTFLKTIFLWRGSCSALKYRTLKKNEEQYVHRW